MSKKSWFRYRKLGVKVENILTLSRVKLKEDIDGFHLWLYTRSRLKILEGEGKGEGGGGVNFFLFSLVKMLRGTKMFLNQSNFFENILTQNFLQKSRWDTLSLHQPFECTWINSGLKSEERVLGVEQIWQKDPFIYVQTLWVKNLKYIFSKIKR